MDARLKTKKLLDNIDNFETEKEKGTEKEKDILGQITTTCAGYPDSINIQLANTNVTPLTLATHRRNQKVIAVLCNYKADVNKKDKNGDTALIIAVRNKDNETVKYLLEAKAKINDIDASKKTALDWVEDDKTQNSKEITTLLLSHGGERRNIRAVTPERQVTPEERQAVEDLKTRLNQYLTHLCKEIKFSDVGKFFEEKTLVVLNYKLNIIIEEPSTISALQALEYLVKTLAQKKQQITAKSYDKNELKEMNIFIERFKTVLRLQQILVANKLPPEKLKTYKQEIEKYKNKDNKLKQHRNETWDTVENFFRKAYATIAGAFTNTLFVPKRTKMEIMLADSEKIIDKAEAEKPAETAKQQPG